MRPNQAAGFSPRYYRRIGGKSAATKNQIAALTNDAPKRATRGGNGRLLAAEEHFGRVIKGSLSILAQERNSR